MVRSISAEAYDKLRSYSEIPDLQVCPVCVEQGFVQRAALSNRTDQVAEFDRLNITDDYAIPKKWIDEWRRGTLPDGVLPTDKQYTIACEHGKRWQGKVSLVSTESLVLLQSVVGGFHAFESNEPECTDCLAAFEGDAIARDEWLMEVKTDKGIRKHLNPSPVVFGDHYYMLPDRFRRTWLDYIQQPGPRPELAMDLCPHGQLDVDPIMEKTVYLSRVGWEMLVEK